MPFDLEHVHDIALEEIEKLPLALQEQGLSALSEFDANPSLDFCERKLKPRMNNLSGRMRSRAERALRTVKEKLGERALQRAIERRQERRSAEAMKQEQLAVYELIARQGRGIVYFGSARTVPGHPDYERGRELGRELHELLGSTSWSGAGPGQMEAPLAGAKEVGGKVGGIKIFLPRKDLRFEQEVSPVFGEDEVVLCKFFAPRKVGLVDAAMRRDEKDRTGFVIFPGGFGTDDEAYEALTLKQLGKLGTVADVPIVYMNYDGFYEQKFAFHEHMLQTGRISPNELKLYRACDSNEEAVAFFAEFYTIDRGTNGGDILTIDKSDMAV